MGGDNPQGAGDENFAAPPAAAAIQQGNEQPEAAGAVSDGDDTAEDTDMSYLNRLVYEVETDGEEGNSSLDIEEEEEEGDEEEDDEEEEDQEDREENEEGNVSGEEIHGEEGEEIEETPSDYEFEYDSDEDVEIKIMTENHANEPRTANPEDSISEESKDFLLWRSDKKESLSDWCIVVSVSNGGRSAKKAYHVHRAILAAGPKKCAYFDAIIRSDSLKESTNNTSEVTLSDEVAACFPAFLDFLYCRPYECRHLIKSDNWRSLHYLAGCFGLPTLSEAIRNFVEKDIYGPGQLERYLADFCGSEGDELNFMRPLLLKACAEMILFEAGSSSVTSLPLAMFLKLLAMLRSSKNIKSIPSSSQCRIFSFALEYIKINEASIDENYFLALTRHLYFPEGVKLAGLLAIDLLEIMNRTGWGVGKWGIEDSCASALSEYLADEDGPSRDEIWEIFDKIPAAVTRTLLEEAIFAKRALNVKKISNVSCKFISEDLGAPKGSVVKISLKSTDPVRRIWFLVSRELNVMAETKEHVVFHNGLQLNSGHTVAQCSISSNAVLELK